MLLRGWARRGKPKHVPGKPEEMTKVSRDGFVFSVRSSYLCALWTKKIKTYKHKSTMKNRIAALLCASMLCLLLPLGVRAQGGMSDEQVLEYAKQAQQSGKNSSQITKELLAKGVTREQAVRVKALYEQENATSTPGGGFADESIRTRNNEAEEISQTANVDEVLGEGGLQDVERREDRIFGRNIFNSRGLTFEPSSNLATPPDYRLGPGDEIVIDIWGASQNVLRERISPEGTISVAELGPISISGKTVQETEVFLKRELSRIYADSSNQIRVTLGGARTVQVNVMGEVVTPGTYSLSAFSTVFHALYCAGGVSDLGTLRNVQVVRGGKKIASVDVYDFILNGNTSGDIRLDEGDVVIVPTLGSVVKISGNVKRPMRYEMLSTESLATLIEYAGGFSSNAYTGNLTVVRRNGKEYEVNTVDEAGYSSYLLQDGDNVNVEDILNRFSNRLEVRGAVYRPGVYELGSDVSTVSDLVRKAEGLMDDAFLGRSVLYRTRDDLTREVVQVDIEGIMSGRVRDVELQKEDVLYIPSIHDLEDLGAVSIKGQVAHPGEYPFAENMTLEDLIIGAGGLLEGASTARVDVARRIKDPKGVEIPETQVESFTLELQDGFLVQGGGEFYLQAYDQVNVRRSPAYVPQKFVSVSGEVLYEGNHPLKSKNYRLSELIEDAGGLTPYAYSRGAWLSRRAAPEEKAQMRTLMEALGQSLGEEMLDSLGVEVEGSYRVGIDLEAALANPGGEEDMILREGDAITVPEMVGTVRIVGAVLFPNVVRYNSDDTVKRYISQAGGYAKGARKRKQFVCYANGQVDRLRRRGQIEPGCEIVVPKREKRGEATLGNTLSYASAFGSLATMAATIGNLLK